LVIVGASDGLLVGVFDGNFVLVGAFDGLFVMVGAFVPSSRQPDITSANFCSAVTRFVALTFTVIKSPST